MAEPAELCPKCNAESVVFDYLEGLSVCESCGAVVEESQLVQHVTEFGDNDSGPTRLGVFVRDCDTGAVAGAALLPRTGTGLRIQQSHWHQGQYKLKSRVREVAGQLRLSQTITNQALHFLEQLMPGLMGSWRRDLIAAAAVYAVCRANQLPLTLLDLSGAMQLDPFTLGKHYRWALQLLGVKPPALEPSMLLARALDQIAASLRNSGCLPEGATLSGLQPDAAMLLQWMAGQTVVLPNPSAAVGTAVVLAAEMCNTPGVTSAAAAGAMHLVKETIDRNVVQVKRRLLELSRLLPYGSQVSLRNVGTHARTIIRLSGLLLAAGHTNLAGWAGAQQAGTQQGGPGTPHGNSSSGGDNASGSNSGGGDGSGSSSRDVRSSGNPATAARLVPLLSWVQEGEEGTPEQAQQAHQSSDHKRKAPAEAEGGSALQDGGPTPSKRLAAGVAPLTPAAAGEHAPAAGAQGGCEAGGSGRPGPGRQQRGGNRSSDSRGRQAGSCKGVSGNGPERCSRGSSDKPGGSDWETSEELEDEFDAELEQYLRRPHEVALLRQVAEASGQWQPAGKGSRRGGGQGERRGHDGREGSEGR